MPPPLELRNKGCGRNVGQGAALAPLALVPLAGAAFAPLAPLAPLVGLAGGDDSALAQAQREALNATTAAIVAATNKASRTATLLAE
jgi:hypothetical protein